MMPTPARPRGARQQTVAKNNIAIDDQSRAAQSGRSRGDGLADTMTQKFALDTIDRNIVEQLRRNGRATNQQIAETLGLTATTVSSRIRRMEDANQLRVVAVSDFAAHGFNFLMQVAIEVDGRPASAVAEELAQFPEVFAAHLVTGRYDIDLLVALRNFDDLAHLLLDKFSQVHGIRTMTPAIVVDIIKYQFDIAPIEARS